MDFSNIFRRAQKLVSDNSPTILTSVAATGTLAVAYFTGKATFKAAEVLENEKNEQIALKIRNNEALRQGRELEPELVLDLKAKVRLVWKYYAPAAGAVGLTIACVIFANRIGTRRAAALATAYSLSQQAWGQYKDAVIERLGPKEEQKVRDELAQKQVNENPNGGVIVVGTGKVLCYEAYTGRYFECTYEDLKAAQNKINYQVLHSMYASLTDFYSEVGLPKTNMSDEFGWNANEQLELHFSSVISDEGKPALSFEYMVAPIRHYDRMC